MDETCMHRWRGPRPGIPATTDVEHVCIRPRYHDDDHECICGVEAPP